MLCEYLNGKCQFNWSSADTLRFKGMGIIMIVFHNFFHLVRTTPRQNEFHFVRRNTHALWDTIIANPEEIIRCTFSFMGHFGVQVFIFLSAYGLTKKFMSQKQPYLNFIKSRYLKIYPAFFMAMVLFFLHQTIFVSLGAAADRLYSKEILFKLLGISNFIPGQALTLVGPWWFLPFIFQFYFIFPLLYKSVTRYGNYCLLIIAGTGIFFTLITNDFLRSNYQINLYFSFLAHLPEICLGIFLARRKKPINHLFMIFLVSLTIFVLGNLNKYIWCLNHISMLILLIYVYCQFKENCHKITSCKKLFLFYGKISLHLFLVNGFLRHPLLKIATQEQLWYMVILYAVLFMLLATIVSTLLYVFNQWFTRKLVMVLPSLQN